MKDHIGFLTCLLKKLFLFFKHSYIMKSNLLLVIIITSFLQIYAQETVKQENVNSYIQAVRSEHLPSEITELVNLIKEKGGRQQDESIVDSTVKFNFSSEIDSVRRMKHDYIWNGSDYISYLYFWNEPDPGWNTYSKAEYYFDENDRIVLYHTFSWDDMLNEWRNSRKIIFTYTEEGQDETIISFDWNVDFNLWDKSYKDSTEYNSEGKVLRSTFWNGDENNEWVPFSKKEYTYNESGSVSTMINSQWDASREGWYYYEKLEYIYADGSLETKYRYGWNVSEQWYLTSKTEYVYDENGNLIMSTMYFLEDDNWKRTTKDEYSYDKDDNLILAYFFIWDIEQKEWKYSRKHEYTYNADGIKLTTVFFEWDDISSSWVGTLNKENIFNEENDLLVSITYHWVDESASWATSDKTFYYRSIVTSITGSTSEILTVYPNPFHSVLSINKESSEVAVCSLLSATGEKINSFVLTGRRTDINLEYLPKGVYFLQFIGHGKKVTKKIIKL